MKAALIGTCLVIAACLIFPVLSGAQSYDLKLTDWKPKSQMVVEETVNGAVTQAGSQFGRVHEIREHHRPDGSCHEHPPFPRACPPGRASATVPLAARSG